MCVRVPTNQITEVENIVVVARCYCTTILKMWKMHLHFIDRNVLKLKRKHGKGQRFTHIPPWLLTCVMLQIKNMFQCFKLALQW